MGKVFFSVWWSGPPREPMTSPSFSLPREKQQSNHNESMEPSFFLSLLQLNPNRTHRFHQPCQSRQITFIENKKSPNPPWKHIGQPIRDQGRGFQSIIRTSIQTQFRPAGPSLLVVAYCIFHIHIYVLLCWTAMRPKILVPNSFWHSAWQKMLLYKIEGMGEDKYH